MEEYAIHTTSYWRDVTCVFLEGNSGDLFLARTYPEGFSLHRAIAAGRNRFIVSSDYGNVEGELEVWDLENARNHIWQRPQSPKSRDMFLWRGDIVLSPDNRYAALCGGERFRKSSVFVIDLAEHKLTELQPNGWTGWDLRMQSIDNNRRLVVSDDGYPTVNQWQVDLKEGVVVHKEVEKQKREPSSAEWEAPLSKDASRMVTTMPVKLQQQNMPHELYMIDKKDQDVGRIRRVTARLVEITRDKISGQ